MQTVKVRRKFKQSITRAGVTFASGEYEGERVDHYLARDIESLIDREIRETIGRGTGVHIEVNHYRFVNPDRNLDHCACQWIVSGKGELDGKQIGSLVIGYSAGAAESNRFEITIDRMPGHLKYSVKLGHGVETDIQFDETLSYLTAVDVILPGDVADPLLVLGGLAKLAEAVVEVVEDSFVLVEPERYNRVRWEAE